MNSKANTQKNQARKCEGRIGGRGSKRGKATSPGLNKKNRFQNTFTVCNLTLDAVVSDMFGKSATDIENYLLDTDTVDPAQCVSLLRGSLKKKSSDVVEAVSGFNMTPEQKERVRIVQGHFADIDHRIAQLDEIIGNLTAEYESPLSLLCTIPGIDRRIAITILSEIGTDMAEFGSSKRLCNWAGLAPANNQSAGKKKSVRISRAGVYLKPALVEAAHAAVKSTEKQPYYRVKYERLMRRCGKKRAIRRCRPCRASSPPASSASSGTNLTRKSFQSVLSDNRFIWRR